MRLSKKKRDELKALAEKGHPREYIDSAVLALPDALADIEELEAELRELEDERRTQCELFIASESKLADAVKALEKYGKHPDSCPKGVGIGYYKPPDDAKCNCGIDASITVKP